MKILPWEQDRWNSRNGNIIPFDKVEHVVRETLLTGVALAFFGPQWAVWVAVEAFGTLYEVYNGLVPYRKPEPGEPREKYIEGFSVKDWLANNGGIAAGTILYYLVLQPLVG